MADIIERVYKITADANDALRAMDKLGKQFESVDSKLAKFGSNMKKIVGALAIKESFEAVVGVIGNAVDQMDDLSKTTQKLGVASEDLIAFSHAAELSDVSTQQLNTGILKLNKAMNDLATGETTKATQALDKLGVNAHKADGSLKGSAEVFEDVAEAMSKLPDGAQKSALAMDVFGKSGAQLIPLLNGGAAGLEEMRKEAEALGLVVDDTTLKMSEGFNDNLTKLKLAGEGAARQLTAGLLPSLLSISNEFVEAAKKGNNFREVGEKIGKALQITKNVFDILALSIKNTFELVTALGTSIGSVVAAFTTGDFSGLADSIDQAWSDANTNIKKNSDEMVKEVQDTATLLSTTGADLAKNVRDNFQGEMDQQPPVTLNVVPKIDTSTFDPSDALAKLDEAVAKSQREFFGVREEANASLEKNLENERKANEERLQGIKDQQKAMRQAKEDSETMKIAIGQTLAGSIDSFVDKVAEGSFKVRDFVRDMIVEIAKLIAQIQILNAIKASAWGASLGLATGGAFSSLGLKPGVYTTPTEFPLQGAGKRYFASGGVGVLGEAGPEAILPLKRTASGRLGVESTGNPSNINIHNYSNAQITARRVDEDIEIIVNRVAADILRGGSKISRAMEGTYSVSRVRGGA